MIKNLLQLPLAIIALSLAININSFSKPVTKVASPNKKTVVEFQVTAEGALQYKINVNGKDAINWSGFAIVTNLGTLGEQIALKDSKIQYKDESFIWPLGERDSVINRYNEIKLFCESGTLNYILVARVFNNSVALRYVLPQQTQKVTRILKENTSFTFPDEATVYQYNQETVFTPTLLDTMAKTCDFPATVLAGQFYYSIGEAENDWYTKAELKKGTIDNSLITAVVKDKEVKIVNGTFQLPWRTISIAENAIGLHNFSDLTLRLVEADLKNISPNIKPGKLIRSGLSTQAGIACIDFASKHNLQYIMFDAGWYGKEFKGESDPTQVIPEMDLPQIIKYGKEKNVGIILYVNRIALRAKLDSLLPLYKQWGVSGFKFGFIDGLSQEGITWLTQAVKKVNDYGFILNIHDNYKPTGLNKKYPYLLTQEGIRGDENGPDAFHNTTLPYTRFLAGAADFTFCYANSKKNFSKNLKVSKAQQLALSVIYFSPLQSLYWYGDPKDYTRDDEIEFFDYVPTVWNESYYLAGEIGKNISVARRNGDTWFVGSAAGLEDWESTINLFFLKSGVKYEASVYNDDGANSIYKTKTKVKKGDKIAVKLKAKEGQAIIIRPIK